MSIVGGFLVLITACELDSPGSTLPFPQSDPKVSASLSGLICTRLDECNALVEQSVTECVDDWEDLLDALSPTELADCSNQLVDCLDLQSCDNFARCEVDLCF